MVESNLFPICCGMAVPALFSEAAFVEVVFLMTGQALGWCIAIFGFRYVAGFALGFLGVGMGACECKIRLRVVEAGFVDRCDVLSPPLVVGMTLAAFSLFFQSTMKALLAFYVMADIFMAVLA